jgi:hypothetical protein
MNCSLPDAFSLFFNRWRDERTTLLVTVDRGIEGTEAWRVESTSPGKGLVNIVKPGIAGAVPVNIASANGFSYEDWRDTPPPEGITRRWRCFLSIDFPDGRNLLFAEAVPGMEDTP